MDMGDFPFAEVNLLDGNMAVARTQEAVRPIFTQ